MHAGMLVESMVMLLLVNDVCQTGVKGVCAAAEGCTVPSTNVRPASESEVVIYATLVMVK